MLRTPPPILPSGDQLDAVAVTEFFSMPPCLLGFLRRSEGGACFAALGARVRSPRRSTVPRKPRCRLRRSRTCRSHADKKNSTIHKSRETFLTCVDWGACFRGIRTYVCTWWPGFSKRIPHRKDKRATHGTLPIPGMDGEGARGC